MTFFKQTAYILLLQLTLLQYVSAQNNLKPLDHADVHRWRKVERPTLSNDGQWAAWLQTPVTEGDPVLYLHQIQGGMERTFDRGSDFRFSEDNKLLVFKVKPALDSLKALRRKKVKDDDLPKDTLVILTLANGQVEKIARLKSYALPEKWAGCLLFQLDPEKAASPKKDTAAAKVKVSLKKAKKEDKENGSRLFVRNTDTGIQDTIAYVTQYAIAKKGKSILFQSSGQGDTMTYAHHPAVIKNGIYLWAADSRTVKPLCVKKGKFQQLSLDEQGNQAAFLADLDTTKARIRPLQLWYWNPKLDSATMIANDQSAFLSTNKTTVPGYMISEHAKPLFSEDGSKLYFGMAPQPILNDTTLLTEEIVQVEVWAWTEKKIYTQQKNNLENDKKQYYPIVFHTKTSDFVPIGSAAIPEFRFQYERNANLALGFNEEPYGHYITSEGTPHKDLYAVNLKDGTHTLILKDLRCNPQISPSAKYITWWSDSDTAWFAWPAATGKITRLTDNLKNPFYDEDNDVPDYPNEYGLAGWLQNDEAMLMYDKYDLWNMDPKDPTKRQRLTQGRESQITYRYIRLDPDLRTIDPKSTILLHAFHHDTKAEGYYLLDLKTNTLKPWMGGDAMFSRQPIKAKNAETMLFSKENYANFPDLQLTQWGSTQTKQISRVNPQQREYQWGSVEMVQWTSLSGQKLKGMLFKPDGFDPAKQYPMIVNFYEQVTDEFHRHRSPDFHRSQINFTFYASRGYVVFSPDIAYRTGYPGECAYDAIVSGVANLIDRGFIDPKRVALQGHSWGGYQAAYLVTRTNLFACAEAGAPVANMTSAYGGIRWESGLSRAFQYEHQQSRIGGSLWESPKQYIENSPLFALDKVETPVLILHNDKDGAVPWYQGIELYSGLRRLGKPAWMLNYNDEPHWPVKLQNRVDFQHRMQQFFDHYLLGGAMPSWMQRGVTPAEKGILQGF